MSDAPRRGPLDAVVDALARLLDAIGLNGTRLRWRWQQRRREAGESKARAEMMLRSARAKHRMCRECRALVPRSATRCPECGEATGGAGSRPGAGRVVTNLLPGISRVCSLLMLANGFWFVLMLTNRIRNGEPLGLFANFERDVLLQFGAGLGASFDFGGVFMGGEWWRIVTPIFLHGGLIHLAFNSMFLINLGPAIEELLESDRFWVVYLVSGIAGAALSESALAAELRNGYVVTVGASGALFGLVGFLLAYGYREGGRVWEGVKAMMWRLVLFILVISLLVGNIDHLNHLGGFAAGGVFGLLVRPGRRRTALSRNVWTALAFVGVATTIVAFYFAAMSAQRAAGGI